MMFKAPFSTLVALLCLMASPAMSAPLSAREYSIAQDIAARAVAASPQQGSEALGIFSLIGDGLQGLGHLIESKTSSKRDLTAREYAIAYDLAARATAAPPQQGSEAFGIFSLIGDGLQGLGHLIESKTSSKRDLTARDYAIAYDLAARAAAAPPQQGSEALGIFSLIGDGLEGLGHFVEDKTSNKKSRDLSDLIARKNTLYMEHGPAVYHTPTHASPRFDSYR
ncbi:uncharacterized protein LAESUDRAFT_303997 [Laetiporus sulphureus 93-53]|uniref:Uncharacterized protein n=1 Tax=Laetiporus sulphureus 93-53 TaxID=1314785 RepID=A0A165D846_9APHY|nr:uncharacterized protein LAESUDRAFT_303997 [Laetiporus sulphureus 93-53]KZT04300.1 hypothetical protein LAESUDRAFT_303997 [Laetiporus sulphureus 93-53]